MCWAWGATMLCVLWFLFFFNDTATTEIYTLSLHDALPISLETAEGCPEGTRRRRVPRYRFAVRDMLVTFNSVFAGFGTGSGSGWWRGEKRGSKRCDHKSRNRKQYRRLNDLSRPAGTPQPRAGFA